MPPVLRQILVSSEDIFLRVLCWCVSGITDILPLIFIVYLHPALVLHLFVLCHFALTPLDNLHYFNLHRLIFSLTPVGWLRSLVLTPYF